MTHRLFLGSKPYIFFPSFLSLPFLVQKCSMSTYPGQSYLPFFTLLFYPFPNSLYHQFYSTLGPYSRVLVLIHLFILSSQCRTWSRIDAWERSVFAVLAPECGVKLERMPLYSELGKATPKYLSYWKGQRKVDSAQRGVSSKYGSRKFCQGRKDERPGDVLFGVWINAIYSPKTLCMSIVCQTLL